MRQRPIPPEPGQESVWDYPRPPRLEAVAERLLIRFAGRVLVDTASGHRVLETSHPPTYYVPPSSIVPGVLVGAGTGTVCEWKGAARYFDVIVDGRRAPRAAWTYPAASGDFAAIAGHVAFYAGPMDECRVGDALVTPQPGGFYGGWITPRVVGPFKGEPGTWGW